jgi:hypothetical protein
MACSGFKFPSGAGKKSEFEENSREFSEEITETPELEEERRARM